MKKMNQTQANLTSLPSLSEVELPRIPERANEKSAILFGRRRSIEEPAHNLYYELRGNPEGTPILALHGGPGYIFPDDSFNFLSLEDYCLIHIHQRGAGRSTPKGEVSGNTLAHLVEDCESVREAIGLESWHILGWSFGSMVALEYLARYPEVFDSLTLFGTFLGTQQEEEFMVERFLRTSPLAEEFRQFCEERGHSPKDYVHVLYALLQSGEVELAAQYWFEVASERVTPDLIHRTRLGLTYAEKGYYFEFERNAQEIRFVPPIQLLYGEDDDVVPFDSTERIKGAFEGTSVQRIPGVGHDITEEAVQEVLREIYSHRRGISG